MAIKEINNIIQESIHGYEYLKKCSLTTRVKIMHTIADFIEALGDELFQAAHEETALPLARLQNEKKRTIYQWRSYADAIKKGYYADARIDNANDSGKADIRKYNIGIGPVAVFGASNFPFAFSTAGGDTASAIAAGCSVVYKEHPGHPKTSRIMAKAIQEAISLLGLPNSIFGYINGDSNLVGETLVKHPAIKAVAFTGSFKGGMALFKLATNRTEPIPVFAEMGSINPVVLLPKYLEENTEAFAKQYISSLTMGVGQFCTNPGLLIAIKSSFLEKLKINLINEVRNCTSSTMLNPGILTNYQRNQLELAKQQNVSLLAQGFEGFQQATTSFYYSTCSQFLKNPKLEEEVFGPTGLLIECENQDELELLLKSLKGQLTLSFAATEDELLTHKSLVEIAQNKAGRILFNGMPTGVEVVYAMQHGGPYPASTDSRFTSVGPDAIKRFLRPVSFQNFPDALLPDELKEANPLQIERIVDNERVLN